MHGRRRVRLGDGRYKTCPENCISCPGCDPYDAPSYEPELEPLDLRMTASECELPCVVCMDMGIAYKSRVARVNPRVRANYSKAVRETTPISNEELLTWGHSTLTQRDCVGCQFSITAIREELASVKRRRFHCQTIVYADVGSSYGKADEGGTR